MNMNKPIIDLEKITSENVSAERAIEIITNDSKKIKSIDFKIPKLGKSGFGSFKVKWKNPRFGISS